MDVKTMGIMLGSVATVVGFAYLSKSSQSHSETCATCGASGECGCKAFSQSFAEAGKKPVYSAIFLDGPSKEKLLSWWDETTGQPRLAKSFGHHMTIKFKPSPAEVSSLPMGQSARLKVKGWAGDERGQAVAVDSEVPSANDIAHITVATNMETSPAYSNELLRRGYRDVDGPELYGIVDTFPR